MSKLKSDKLFLLEKLVQSSSDGEVTTEQRDLFVNLVKETSPNSPNMRKKSANAADRNSRQRVKVRSNSHEVEDINHGKVQIPLPETENRSRSRSRSSGSRSRSSSSSSFWSSGSQDRARIRKTSSGSRSPSHSSSGTYSRSRSGSRSRSQSRSRSRSGSSSRSRSRSRSPSMEYSRNKIRERSKSPPVSKSREKEPRSGSLSSTQSAPTKPLVQKQVKKSRDSASDSGRNDKGKRRKLLKRGEVRKYRSFDINPDVFIEERLKQKYKELNNLLASQFTGSQIQMTHQQFQQMQNLRTQYMSASHGLPPSGVLIPRSLPHDMRVKRGAPQGLTKRRSKSRDTLNSDFGEDHTYVSVQRVLNTTAAREGRVIVDPHPVSIKKKKKIKKTDSNTKLNSTLDSNSDHTGSRTLSPRSRIEIHHLKDTENPDLLKWLKQKDKEHRKNEREERKKRREEREKLVLEANEKFERRLESQKIVKKWRTEKEKEYRKMLKEKKNQEKEAEIQQKAKMEMSLPGKSMVVRPQTAPLEWKRKTDNSTPKIKKEKERKEEVSKKASDTIVKAQTVQDQLGTSSGHLKFDLNDHQNNDQLPPTSKFMYKRPVAGKIKLNMRNRPMSAQPKLQTTNNLEAETSRSVQEGHDRNSRMSYDDWVNTKRKQDQEKRKREKMRQKEELSKSDPEIAKLVPDIAKKRIHNILNERKSIDTGIKRYDETVNHSFGGGSFDRSKSPNVTTKTSAYKWADDRPATAKDRTVESLKVAGKSYQRPGTAPSGGRKVPVPMRSPYSPVPAHTPARVEEILNNDDQSNPFKLPFPAEEGVPKHVADMQKKLFSDENFKKNERLEPQNGSSSLDIVPSTSAVASAIQDIKYDNITAIDQSSNVQHDEKKDYKTDKKKDHRTEDQKKPKVGEKEKNIGEELHSRLTAHVENTDKVREFNEMNHKPEIGNKGVIRTEETAKKLDESVNLNTKSEGVKQLIDSDENSDTSLPEELAYENSENSNEKVENEQTAVDEVDNKHEINYVVRENDNENNLNQSAKHVSFCEEPEVFIDPDGPDWSTDTGTPDEDNSRYTTKEDLSKLIDSCGELLNSEYGDQNDDDKAFLTESLDEDF